VTTRRAKVFWSGRSQAVRLPKEFRFSGESVLVRRKGKSVILEPENDWPEGYVDSFAECGTDLARPPQGSLERRDELE
jgi:antitoxin VapB